jgi:type I restriction enzyme R subunit
MSPEQRARRHIDERLAAAGWVVQDYAHLNLGAGPGVAVREFPLKTGFADYLLFVGRKAVGVIEAKPEGTTLGGVAEQSAKYLTGLPEAIPHVEGDTLPFAYESTGVETYFRDEHDPEARSRRVYAFHRPESIQAWVERPATLRARLRVLPPLLTEGLRACQVEAIEGLEQSLKDNRPRALIQMATGSGKTYTAVTASYRLIKFADARRILFLVDRANLGRQTEKEFQQYVTPDDGRKFAELYNIQRLTTNTVDPVSRVCIETIQRVYSMLKGRDLDEANEEASLYETAPDGKPLDVVYNATIPPETFDVIIVDETHRSIYKKNPPRPTPPA